MPSKTLLEIIGTAPVRDRSPVCRGLAKPAELDAGELAVDPKGGDRKMGLIRGAALIARGEALGHRSWIDDTTLQQVAEFGNQSSKGVKVRFTHPSLSGDGLGSFLGRAKNLRVQDDKTLGDVHFSPAAHETPDGNLAAYVMQLAEDDPESFGMSIVFEHDPQAEREFVRAHEKVDEDGDTDFISPDPDNEHNYRHTRLRQLFAVDFVDEPAANPEGLFHRGPSKPILEQAERLTEYALGLSTEDPGETGGVSSGRIKDFLTRFLASRGLTLTIEDSQMSKETKTPETEQSEVQSETKTETPVELLSADTKIEPTNLKSEGATEERKRAKQIRVLCEMSGCPEKADKFIDAEFSVEETRESLSAILEKQNKVIPADDSSDATPETNKLATIEKGYKAEYAAQKGIHTTLGISEAEYVEQRLIEDGHKEQPEIMPGLAPAA